MTSGTTADGRRRRHRHPIAFRRPVTRRPPPNGTGSHSSFALQLGLLGHLGPFAAWPLPRRSDERRPSSTAAPPSKATPKTLSSRLPSTETSPASKGHLEVCKYLVEELGVGADPNITADAAEGLTPVMASAQSGDVSTVKYLLDHGGDLMKSDEKGCTVLHHAALTGSCSVTEFLLSKGIPVDIDSGHGTPLLHAAMVGQDKTLKILLDHHANPNFIFSGIGNPLMGALVNRSLKCMKLLIKASADVNGKGTITSPLLIATEHGEIIPTSFSYC